MTKIEWLKAQDIDELIWLKLKRLTSVKLCENILKIKAQDQKKTIEASIIQNKSIGMSSSIESSINYWNFKTDSLNLKILSRYYALLHMTIAEQVSSIKNTDGLSEIQKYTEVGHGLSNIKDENNDFPGNYYISLLKGGYFHSYSKFLGQRKIINNIAFDKKPKKYSTLSDQEKDKLISLVSLLRRIPELRPVIYEYLGLNPLSFHVIYDHLRNNTIVAPKDTKKTLLKLKPENADISRYKYSELNWKFKFVKIEEDGFIVEYEHSTGKFWHQYLNLYHSNYCGSSYILPIKGIQDPILINLMILYSLSIIVRYLPNLWYEIYHGELDHIGSLIDYYISIFDHVMPLTMLERITDTKIDVNLPGTMNSPI